MVATEGHVKGEEANVPSLVNCHLQLLVPHLTEVRDPAGEIVYVSAMRLPFDYDKRLWNVCLGC